MRILVLGGNGMAGHIISNYLHSNLTNDLYYSLRSSSKDVRAVTLDLTDDKSTYNCLKTIKPDIVINAAGILNNDAAERLKESIYINSLLPHKLANYGDELGFQLIHISTDCVFSGLKGSYVEADRKDGTSIYAITKNLGEVNDPKHVTIRTSIIGPELRKQGIGLFHWFMKQSGTIQGYQGVLWNGVTTIELAKAIIWVIQNKLSGLVHLTGRNRISKYDLLLLFKEVFKMDDIEISPTRTEKSDKTLVNTRNDFSYIAQDYKSMIIELKEWIESNHHQYSNYTLK
ncbi:SDR family oxidoreductase [Bacillus sp. RG28]|uniref:dTDP-4-dehydrorhamnose reductase n=1 Tax=Gottfriedia endophytica TaxID=2820819 RepID=A0A940NPD7_9BACI|nr:SDR family oxidoreductase [Gottfriedia endophytica]MBP0724451.1 SDR family oxidoreductase [Gottfriedia endophytica]